MSFCLCEMQKWQGDFITEEVADEVFGEVRTQMMLSDSLYRCEFILPPGPPKTWVITLIPMCHLTSSYYGICGMDPAVGCCFLNWIFWNVGVYLWGRWASAMFMENQSIPSVIPRAWFIWPKCGVYFRINWLMPYSCIDQISSNCIGNPANRDNLI